MALVGASGAHFGVSEKVTLSSPKKADQTIPMKPVLISEGITSLREAARAGLGSRCCRNWLDSGKIFSQDGLVASCHSGMQKIVVHVVYIKGIGCFRFAYAHLLISPLPI